MQWSRRRNRPAAIGPRRRLTGTDAGGDSEGLTLAEDPGPEDGEVFPKEVSA
jgi:hypothetical protein